MRSRPTGFYRKTKHMELKIPPVLLLILTAALMWLSARLLPDFPLPAAAWAAGITAAAGLAVIGAGIYAFRRARTTVNPHTPEKSSGIVSDGIYRFTRNPMYLGMMLILTGWALWLGQTAAWPWIALFAAYLTRFQIRPEERILAAKFGTAYTDYCRRVRRWL